MMKNALFDENGLSIAHQMMENARFLIKMHGL